MSTDDVITIISLSIGLLGLIASLVGTYLAYISFINPLVRFKCYLRKPKSWEKVYKDKPSDIYRHKKHPAFQLIVNWNNEIVDGFEDTWIRDYPDKRHNCSYFVILEANGTFLGKELFVSLDGSRAFVPVPSVTMNGEERVFFYDKLQIQIANIVGKYSWEKDIEEFASHQKIPIKIVAHSDKKQGIPSLRR
jgi:hypothetical protein